jgi:hypothetical protein
MAEIAIDTRRAPSRLRLQLATALAALRERRAQRRALVKLLSEWDRGIATGSRGLTGSPTLPA